MEDQEVTQAQHQQHVRGQPHDRGSSNMTVLEVVTPVRHKQDDTGQLVVTSVVSGKYKFVVRNN